MSIERINLYNPVQEQLNILRDMRRYHQEMTDADIVASLNVQFADRLEVVESEPVQPVQNDRKLSRKQRRAARRVQNARHKQADRLHGKSTYVYRYKEDGQIKEAVSGNEYRNWATWVRTMHSWGDPEGKKRRLPRTQSINVHFTDAARPDIFDMSEGDVAQTWSVSSHDLSMEDFFQYMDNMDWKRIPTEVRFSVDWNAENPFTSKYPEPEYFEMSATFRRTQKTVSAEKAKQEYLKFKKEYQIFLLFFKLLFLYSQYIYNHYL